MDAEVTIIGAGVIGLAIAAEISRHTSSVFVVERHPYFGMESSSRNSEVIHSGIYYTKGSLKARMCREGRDLLYAYCETHDIPYNRCGKLIVATRKEEFDKLEDIRRTAQANEVTNYRLLVSDEIRELEPNIRAARALYFPSSGIFDSHAFMQSLENESVNNGTDFAYGCKVTGIARLKEKGYSISILDADGTTFDFSSRRIINASGLEAENVALMAGICDDNYRTYLWKGEYFALLNGKHKLIKRLIYPTPEPDITGLGIHTTPDIAGRMKLGPNTIFLPDGKIDYSVNPEHADDFLRNARTFLPFLEPGDLAPDQAGIRPKLQKPGDTARDFIIREESGRGYPGFVNLIGIESPGLTAALSIGKYVQLLLK